MVRDVLKKQKGKWRSVDLSSIDIGVSESSSYLKGFHFDEELGGLRVCGGCGPKNYLNGFFLAILERVEDKEE